MDFMSKLEFEYFDIEDMDFCGDEVLIFFPEIDNIDFGALWGGVMQNIMIIYFI